MEINTQNSFPSNQIDIGNVLDVKRNETSYIFSCNDKQLKIVVNEPILYRRF